MKNVLFVSLLLALISTVAFSGGSTNPITCVCMDWNSTGPGLQGEFDFADACGLGSPLLTISAKEYVVGSNKAVQYDWSEGYIRLLDGQSPPHPVEDYTVALEISAYCYNTNNKKVNYYGALDPSDCSACP